MNLCAKEGCINEALWRPVLLLYGPLSEEPAEAVMDMGLCYGCKARAVLTDLVDSKGFRELCKVFELNGLAPPYFDRTEVRWEPLLSLDLEGVDELQSGFGEP